MHLSSGHLGFLIKEGWDLESRSYIGQSISLTTLTTNLRGIFISSDGTKAYFSSSLSTTDKVFQLDLSTPWDITTATYNTKFISTASQASYVSSVHFSSDGSKMYIIGPTEGKITQYNLSTPWVITTAVYSTQYTFSVSDTIWSAAFNITGNKLYVVGNGNVYQFNLSTAWSISTLTYESKVLGVAGSTFGKGFIKDDGKKYYLIVGSGTDIKQYNLSTAFDISTATLEKTVSFLPQASSLSGIFIKGDGTGIYLMDLAVARILQYSL